MVEDSKTMKYEIEENAINIDSRYQNEFRNDEDDQINSS
jgi:hypothetical protein